MRDEGIGIAPADVERVFERFVQGEAGDRRRFGGIGLGLYIVRQLARAQGGEVTAAPAPGGGTIMRLRLPRARRCLGALWERRRCGRRGYRDQELRDDAEPAAAGTQAARLGEAENYADEAAGPVLRLPRAARLQSRRTRPNPASRDVRAGVAGSRTGEAAAAANDDRPRSQPRGLNAALGQPSGSGALIRFLVTRSLATFSPPEASMYRSMMPMTSSPCSTILPRSSQITRYSFRCCYHRPCNRACDCPGCDRRLRAGPHRPVRCVTTSMPSATGVPQARAKFPFTWSMQVSQV